MQATNAQMAATASLGRVIPGMLTAAERNSERAVYGWVRALASESAEAERICRRLRARVAAGGEGYEEAWRDRDNLSEAIDELCDFVAYLLFEGVRREAGQRADLADQLGVLAQEAVTLCLGVAEVKRSLEAGR